MAISVGSTVLYTHGDGSVDSAVVLSVDSLDEDDAPYELTLRVSVANPDAVPGCVNGFVTKAAAPMADPGDASAQPGTWVDDSVSGDNSGDVTLAAVGAVPNANGATLTGQQLKLQPASAAHPGAMLAADKAKLDAITGTHTGTNTGDVTLAAVGAVPNANGASLTGQALNLEPADGTHPGAVSLSAQTLGSGVKTAEGLAVTGATVPANGLCLPSASTLGFSAGSAVRASIDANGFRVNSGLVVDLAPGEEAYIYRVAGDTISVGSTGGNLRVTKDLIVNNTTQMKGPIEVTLGDSSGSPGDATVNTAAGRSAIENGETDVTIATNKATAGKIVIITWEGDHGAARSWVTYGAAGSFTVHLSGAAGGNTAFNWLVIVP